MFEAIMRIYEKTQSKLAVRNAVKKGWITSDDYFAITGEVYV